MTRIIARINAQMFFIILMCSMFVAFFVYEGFAGMFAIGLFVMVIGFLSWLGLIPYVGVFIAYFTSYYLGCSILGWTGITATWLTSTIFVWYIVLALALTINTTIIAHKYKKASAIKRMMWRLGHKEL